MAFKEKIKNCFNSRAYTYDAGVDIQTRVAERLAQQLPNNAPRNILEIGCGTGLFSQYLLHAYPHAQILLTDIAPAMVTICCERFATALHITLSCMDGEFITTTETFDLIVSSMTLHWFTHFKESLQHIIAKLNPGGKFIFAALGQNSLTEWREICRDNHVSIPTPAFFPWQAIQKEFPQLTLQIEIAEQSYSSTFAFLKTLQTIGAHAAQKNHVPFSPGLLRRVMNLFDKQNAQDVSISYEIIYGSYTKS